MLIKEEKEMGICEFKIDRELRIKVVLTLSFFSFCVLFPLFTLLGLNIYLI